MACWCLAPKPARAGRGPVDRDDSGSCWPTTKSWSVAPWLLSWNWKTTSRSSPPWGGATKSSRRQSSPPRRRSPRHRDARDRRPGRGRRAGARGTRMPLGHPHHLRAPGLPAPGHGVRCFGLRRQRRPGRAIGRRHPPGDGRRAGGGPGSGGIDAGRRKVAVDRSRTRRAGRFPLWGNHGDIAAKLYLSEGTVRNYLSGAISKTAARNRSEALRVADDAAGFSRGPVGLQAYGPTAKEYRPSAVNGTSQRRGRYSMCNAPIGCRGSPGQSGTTSVRGSPVAIGAHPITGSPD